MTLRFVRLIWFLERSLAINSASRRAAWSSGNSSPRSSVRRSPISTWKSSKAWPDNSKIARAFLCPVADEKAPSGLLVGLVDVGCVRNHVSAICSSMMRCGFVIVDLAALRHSAACFLQALALRHLSGAPMCRWHEANVSRRRRCRLSSTALVHTRISATLDWRLRLERHSGKLVEVFVDDGRLESRCPSCTSVGTTALGLSFWYSGANWSPLRMSR